MRITTEWKCNVPHINGLPIDQITDEELEKARVEFFDRWNWETGSDEDLKVFQEIEEELERRKLLKPEEMLVNQLAKEIADEIDKEIIKDLLALTEEEATK